MLTTPDWIAVDWGTSNLRAWAMGADDTVLAEASSDRGMLRVEAGGFEAALLELIGSWLASSRTILVLAVGMVGARQGWVEAPYAETPCAAIDSEQMIHAPVEDTRLDVRILPGLCQRDPADVMRGEETQIFGFLSAHPGFEGTICLPGTHSKWVRVQGGSVMGFHTAMTGELFQLLSEQSVLKHSMTEGWDDAAFAAGVTAGVADPGSLAASLFAIRAASLLEKIPAGVGKAKLSGMLIGAEVASAAANNTQVALIGGGGMIDLYRTALATQGIDAVTFDAGLATRTGLISAYRTITGASG